MALLLSGREFLFNGVGTLCKGCLNAVTPIRSASSLSKKFAKEEQIKSEYKQYRGINKERERGLYAWGLTVTGALGVKTLIFPLVHQRLRKIQFTPLFIDFFQENNYKIKNISCGYGFTVFSCTDRAGHNKLLGTGINTDSQIGFHKHSMANGNDDNLFWPGLISLPLSNPASTKATHIGCGRAHTVVATDNEGIFTLGSNLYGQCGRKIVDREIFRKNLSVNHLDFDEKVKQVVCGQFHTLVLTEDGRVFSCGLGAEGQTGLGHHRNTDALTLVGGDIKGEKIVQISSKVDTVLAVSDKGDLFGWGNSEYDQLEFARPNDGQVYTPTNLAFNIGKVKIAAASKTVCAVLNEEGRVFTWGRGFLGRGPSTDRCYVPEAIPSTLFHILNNRTAIKDIQCGYNYFAVVTNANALFTWGQNDTACLGLRNKLDHFFPLKAHIPGEVLGVHCGVDHTFAECQSSC